MLSLLLLGLVLVLGVLLGLDLVHNPSDAFLQALASLGRARLDLPSAVTNAIEAQQVCDLCNSRETTTKNKHAVAIATPWSNTGAAESGQCTAGALYLQFWRRERSTSPACWQTQGEGHLPACRPREACPAPGQPQSRRASCQHCLPRTAAQRCVREGCRERERRHQRRPNCECCAGCSTDEGVLVGALTRASVPS